MDLTKQQLGALQEALLSAFPSLGTLRQMFHYTFNKNLAEISAADGMGAVVFELLMWAKAQGQLEALILGARRANSGNPELARFVSELQQAGLLSQVLGVPAASPPSLLRRAYDTDTDPGRTLESERDDAIAQRDAAVAANGVIRSELDELLSAHASAEHRKRFGPLHLVATSAATLVISTTLFAIAHAFMTKPPVVAAPIDPALVVACRTSLLRLKTAAREPEVQLDDLRTSVDNHASACNGPLRELVDLASRGSSVTAPGTAR